MDDTQDTAIEKHTPGPWAVKPYSSDTGDFTVTSPSLPFIANTIGGTDQEHGNALLIAAAPDLLAACKAAELYDAAINRRAKTDDVKRLDAGGAIAEGIDLDTLYHDWCDKAMSAIAKAEGR